MRFTVLLAPLFAGLVASAYGQVYCGFNLTDALLDPSINWNAANFTAAAVAYMQNLSLAQGPNPSAGSVAVDVHSHMVFPWYGQAVPLTAGEATPVWSTEAHLTFAAQYGINHTILANSAPQGNVYPNNQEATQLIARLINLSLAVLSHCRPESFSFFASIPLPYTDAAIAEAEYALDTLGASGVAVLSNHEGIYLGNAQLAPFFKYLNSRSTNTVMYIHPAVPYLRTGSNGNTLVEANPTRYISGLFEFFFETGRVLMDLTLSKTLQHYPKIDYIAAHVGGAFPSILDRMLKSLDDYSFELASKAIYGSRIWWDSAGPAYPRQVEGLDAFVPPSQLLFGTDYPYAPAVSYGPAIGGLKNDTAVNVQAILHDNAINFLGPKIHWSY